MCDVLHDYMHAVNWWLEAAGLGPTHKQSALEFKGRHPSVPCVSKHLSNHLLLAFG